MTASAEKEQQLRRSVLDEFAASLEDEPSMTPAARTETIRMFEQALDDATSRPRSPDVVLDEWKQTMADWNRRLEAMQKRGDLNATDAAAIYRQFDQITLVLENAPSDVEQPCKEESSGAPPASLPQGMPSQVAQALGRTPSKT